MTKFKVFPSPFGVLSFQIFRFFKRRDLQNLHVSVPFRGLIFPNKR